MALLARASSTRPDSFSSDLAGLYKFIPDFLQLISPGTECSPAIIKKPELMLSVLNLIPKDTMNRFYESWSKKEKKGKKVKIRWLSKVINEDIFRTMHRASVNFELPVSPDVYSYKKGVKTADCAGLFVGMKCIVALDIKDYYYAITGKMIEEMYTEWFKLTCLVDRPSEVYKVLCVSKMLSILFMANDVRPANIRYTQDTVLLQGTPHAGMIANAVLYKLDKELADRCRESGLVYARYSDNFYIGSKDERLDQDFIDDIVCRIETFVIGGVANFKIKKEKIKVMHHYTHQRVLGIVVNKHLNISSYTEDIINAKIAKYSAYLNTEYVRFQESRAAAVMPLTRTQLKALMVKVRKDLRELKGLVSYLGSFNRIKYDKYHEYIKFLELRAESMYTLSQTRSSIYPYRRSSEERAAINETVTINRDFAEGTSNYSTSRKHIVMNITDPSICHKFASLFDKGFLGVEYITYDVTPKRILLIPLDIASKYLTLADDIMIISIRESMGINGSPLADFQSENGVSPAYRCASDIRKLGTDVFLSGNAELASIKIYNRENPAGFVDFENYQMQLRPILRSEANVCVVKNNLDSPDIMYSNLWSLRKAILRKEVIISVQ